MIRINNITRGRFGNRILQYNSLMQISKQSGLEARFTVQSMSFQMMLTLP